MSFYLQSETDFLLTLTFLNGGVLKSHILVELPPLPRPDELLCDDISNSTHEQLPLQRLWFYEAEKPTLHYVWNDRGVCWELGSWFVFQIIKRI